VLVAISSTAKWNCGDRHNKTPPDSASHPGALITIIHQNEERAKGNVMAELADLEMWMG